MLQMNLFLFSYRRTGVTKNAFKEMFLTVNNFSVVSGSSLCIQMHEM